MPVTATDRANPDSVGMFLILSKTIGRAFNQFSFLAIIAVFIVLCCLSIIPFYCELYAVVRKRWKPTKVDNSFNNSLSNCDPPSVMTWRGTPNLEIHVSRKDMATVEALMLVIGIASTQRVARSMHVKIYL